MKWAKKAKKAKKAEKEVKAEVTKKTKKDVQAEAPVAVSGPLCACGSPVAAGQSEVCAEHIRVG